MNGNGFEVVARASLLKPLDERAVLVPDEDVYYAERQHWASMVQPTWEAFVFFVFVAWAIGAFRGDGLGNRFLFAILVLAAAQTLATAFSGGRAPVSSLAVDPFSNPGGSNVSRGGLVLIGFGLGLAFLLDGFRLAGIYAVFVVLARWIILLARYWFYERRYITNRRVIESGGFLGSRISSMPLSRVTDINYSRTVLGELLGYATMRVETAGQDQALGNVRFISRPSHFYEVLIHFSAPQSPAPPPGDGPADVIADS